MSKKIKLSVSVMAHPSRAKYFNYLKKKLGDVPFSIDEGWGLTENCKKAWQMYDPTADYHVVIQDDALICNNFHERAVELLQNFSKEKIDSSFDLVYNFYYAHRAALDKEFQLATKTGYIITPVVRWGVAICLPTNSIKEMLKFYDTQNFPQDDERISGYVQSVDARVLFTGRSLIDHRDERSLISSTKDKRCARVFAEKNEICVPLEKAEYVIKQMEIIEGLGIKDSRWHHYATEPFIHGNKMYNPGDIVDDKHIEELKSMGARKKWTYK